MLEALCDEALTRIGSKTRTKTDHMRTQFDDFLALPARRLGFTKGSATTHGAPDGPIQLTDCSDRLVKYRL
jgi:hypothetical protein